MTPTPNLRPAPGPRRSRRLVAMFAALVLVVPLLALAAEDGPVGAASPGAALADSFTRPDHWWIGSAETGQPWQVWSGTAVVAQGQAAASVAGYTLAVADAGVANGTVAATAAVLGDEVWLIFRASDPGNYWRFGRTGGGGYELQQIRGWWYGSPVVTTHSAPVPASGDRLACDLGATVRCSVDGTLVASSADGFNATSTFAGFATAASAGPPATRIDDVEVVTAAPAPDVAIGVVADPASVHQGDGVRWVGTVTNTGPVAASDVAVSGTAPTGVGALTTSPSVGTCSPGSTISCQLGTLAPGASATVVVEGTASATGDLVLALTAGATGDADPGNDTASATVAVAEPVPAGAVVVDDFTRPDAWSMGTAPTGQVWQVWNGTARVASNQAIASEPGYALAVVDTGTATGSVALTVAAQADDVWLIARASGGGDYWRFGRSGGAGYALEQVSGWQMASPPVQVLATVAPAAGDRLECRFLVGITCSVNGVDVASSPVGAAPDARYAGFAAYGASAPPPARIDAFRAAVAPGAPDLVTSVLADTPTVLGGQPVRWTATVRNDGTLPAPAAVLTAPAPAGVTGFAASATVGSCSGGATASCALGELAPGAQATVTYTGTATTTIGTRTLVVSASTAAADGDTSNDEASAPVSVRVLAAPGESFTDRFDRPDAPTLGTVQGRPWDPWTGTMGVVGGRAATTSTAPGWAGAAIDTGFTYGTLQVRLAAGAQDGFQVVFRGRSPADHYRLTTDADGHYRIQKVLGGRLIDLQFNAIRANVRATDGDLIRLVVRPDDGWFVSINGVHVLDGGDVDLLGEHRFGLVAASPTVRFDDLTITQPMTTAMTTTERFTRPDGTVLELATPTSGTLYTWRAPMGWWAHRSGRGVLESPGYGLATLETSSQRARAQVVVRSTAPAAWLVFRHAEDGSHHRFGRAAGRSAYTFERLDAQGQLQPIPGLVVHRTVRPAAGDRLEVRQAADGAVRGYVNGVLVASYTDTINGVAATAYGIAGEQGVTFDDLVITAP